MLVHRVVHMYKVAEPVWVFVPVQMVDPVLKQMVRLVRVFLVLPDMVELLKMVCLPWMGVAEMPQLELPVQAQCRPVLRVCIEKVMELEPLPQAWLVA